MSRATTDSAAEANLKGSSLFSAKPKHVAGSSSTKPMADSGAHTIKPPLGPAQLGCSVPLKLYECLPEDLSDVDNVG